MAKIKSFGERIADALVEDGLLGANQVEELLEQQKKEGARLVKLIVEKAYVSEQDLAVCMGRVLNVTPINLARVNIPPELVDLFPRETMHNHKVIPISRLENKLFLAMADPLNVLGHRRRQAHHQAGNHSAHRLRKGHRRQAQRH